MTTAHRPTWKAAYGLSDGIGKGNIPTRSYSARDQPGYLKLKERQPGQGSIDELKEKDFRAELLKREADAQKLKSGLDQAELTKLQTSGVDFVGSTVSQPSKRVKHQEPEVNIEVNPYPQDEDSEGFIEEDEDINQRKRVQSDDDGDSISQEDDDSQELLRQYEKIKAQREKEELHKKEEQHRQSKANRERQLLKGNPLIDSSYSLSKRWYEDTVFRNQAKKLAEKKGFVNDYVRSDFHRKFMERFVMR